MSRQTHFVETPNGICAINPIMGEFTICGDAFDLDSDIADYEQKITTSRIVTCQQCAIVIVNLRNVKVEQ